MKENEIGKAIDNLWLKNTFTHRGMKVIVACLLRTEDWRPLKASWWRGKEASLIGADLDGNFILRHCDGSVRYWNHATQTDVVISPSVRDFVAGLSENKDNNA